MHAILPEVSQRGAVGRIVQSIEESRLHFLKSSSLEDVHFVSLAA